MVLEVVPASRSTHLGPRSMSAAAILLVAITLVPPCLSQSAFVDTNTGWAEQGVCSLFRLPPPATAGWVVNADNTISVTNDAATAFKLVPMSSILTPSGLFKIQDCQGSGYVSWGIGSLEVTQNASRAAIFRRYTVDNSQFRSRFAVISLGFNLTQNVTVDASNRLVALAGPPSDFIAVFPKLGPNVALTAGLDGINFPITAPHMPGGFAELSIVNARDTDCVHVAAKYFTPARYNIWIEVPVFTTSGVEDKICGGTDRLKWTFLVEPSKFPGPGSYTDSYHVMVTGFAPQTLTVSLQPTIDEASEKNRSVQLGMQLVTPSSNSLMVDGFIANYTMPYEPLEPFAEAGIVFGVLLFSRTAGPATGNTTAVMNINKTSPGGHLIEQIGALTNSTCSKFINFDNGDIPLVNGSTYTVLLYAAESEENCVTSCANQFCSYLSIATTGAATCFLRNGTGVVCMGSNATGELAVPQLPPGRQYQSVQARGDTFCGVVAHYGVVCWGGGVQPGLSLTPPPSSSAFYNSFGGPDFNCLSSTSDVVCVNQTSGAVQTLATGTVTQYQMCATNTTVCWYLLGSIQCSPIGSGRGSNAPLTEPAMQLVCSNAGLCELTFSQNVNCAGDVLSFANINSILNSRWSQICMSNRHVCAIARDGSITCAGHNEFGQASPPSGSFVQVTCSDRHSCAVSYNGSVVCWGDNMHGQAPASTAYTARLSSTGSVTTSNLCSTTQYIGLDAALNVTYATVDSSSTLTCTPLVQLNGIADCVIVPKWKGAVVRIRPHFFPVTATAGEAGTERPVILQSVTPQTAAERFTFRVRVGGSPGTVVVSTNVTGPFTVAVSNGDPPTSATVSCAAAAVQENQPLLCTIRTFRHGTPIATTADVLSGRTPFLPLNEVAGSQFTFSFVSNINGPQTITSGIAPGTTSVIVTSTPTTSSVSCAGVSSSVVKGRVVLCTVTPQRTVQGSVQTVYSSTSAFTLSMDPPVASFSAVTSTPASLSAGNSMTFTFTILTQAVSGSTVKLSVGVGPLAMFTVVDEQSPVIESVHRTNDQGDFVVYLSPPATPGATGYHVVLNGTAVTTSSLATKQTFTHSANLHPGALQAFATTPVGLSPGSNLAPSNALLVFPEVVPTLTGATISWTAALPGELYAVFAATSTVATPATVMNGSASATTAPSCRAQAVSFTTGQNTRTVVCPGLTSSEGATLRYNTPYHFHMLITAEGAGAGLLAPPVSVQWNNVRDLKSLTVTSPAGVVLSPAFSPSNTLYSASVGDSTSAVGLTVETLDPLATVSIGGTAVTAISGTFSGACPISGALVRCEIIVTSQLGEATTYLLAISVSSSLNKLVGMAFNTTLPIEFPVGASAQASFTLKFRTTVATALGLPLERVTLTRSITRGSVVVNFLLVTENQNTAALRANLDAQLADPNSALRSTPETSGMTAVTPGEVADVEQCGPTIWAAVGMCPNNNAACPINVCSAGTCVITTVDGQSLTQCICPPGFVGSLCQHRVWQVKAGSLQSSTSCSQAASGAAGRVDLTSPFGNVALHLEFAASGAENATVYVGTADLSVKFPCVLKTPFSRSAASAGTDPTVAYFLPYCCELGPGYGRGLVPIVLVNDTHVVGTDVINYPAPRIVPNTLQLPSVVGPVSLPLVTQTVLGDLVTFGTENLFLNATNQATVARAEVKFGPPSNPSQFTCSLVAMSVTRVICRLPAGEFSNMVFYIALPGTNATGVDVFSTPIPPSITNITGCAGTSATGRGTTLCPTKGGVSITLHGSQLFLPLSITVDSKPCFPVAVSGTEGKTASCQLPAGVGFGVRVAAYQGDLVSAPLTEELLSYAPPVPLQLKSLRGECQETAALALTNCNRTGGDLIQIIGTNFGASDTAVFIGADACRNVTQDPLAPHERLTCVLPSGNRTQRTVLLLQDGGEISSSAAVVSYRQCSAGLFERGLDCLPCDVGTANGAVAQTQCTPCVPGRYAPSERSESCTACGIGKFQNVSGQSFCRDCLRGTFAQAEGLAVCPDCGPGSFSDQSGADECRECAIGRYQPNIGQSGCLDCKPADGQFQLSAGQSVCSVCVAGRYAVFPDGRNFSRCEDCPLGTLCIGDGSIVTTEGYYMSFSSVGTVQSVACPEGFCLENNTCQENRVPDYRNNPLCGLCIENHHEWGGKCVYCGQEYNWAWLVPLFILFLGVVVVFHRLSQVSSTAALKIVMYYLQNAFLFVGRNVALQWLELLNFRPANSSGSFVCLYAVSSFGRVGQGFFMAAVAPFCLGLVALGHFLYTRYHSGQPDPEDEEELDEQPERERAMSDASGDENPDGSLRTWTLRRDKSGRAIISEKEVGTLFPKVWNAAPYYRTLIALYTFSFNGICTSVFEYLDCVELASGQVVVREFPSIDCETARYRFWLIPAILLLLTVTVILPLFFFYKLNQGRLRRKLRKKSFVRKYGVLIDVYRSSALFWELTVLVRRAALVATVVFLARHRVAMLSVVSLINTTVLVWHMREQPYINNDDNISETFSLLSLCVLSISLPIGGDLPYDRTPLIIYAILALVPGFVLLCWALWTQYANKVIEWAYNYDKGRWEKVKRGIGHVGVAEDQEAAEARVRTQDQALQAATEKEIRRKEFERQRKARRREKRRKRAREKARQARIRANGGVDPNAIEWGSSLARPAIEEEDDDSEELESSVSHYGNVPEFQGLPPEVLLALNRGRRRPQASVPAHSSTLGDWVSRTQAENEARQRQANLNSYRQAKRKNKQNHERFW